MIGLAITLIGYLWVERLYDRYPARQVPPGLLGERHRLLDGVGNVPIERSSSSSDFILTALGPSAESHCEFSANESGLINRLKP